MESTELKVLCQTIDDIRHENGVEYWYARELYPVLGYMRWENFETAVNRAKEACKKSGSAVEDHFRGVTKSVKGGISAWSDEIDHNVAKY